MSATVEELQARRAAIQSEINKAEKQIFEHEGGYLGAEYSQLGTVLKGLEGFLFSKDALKRRPRQFRLEDRLFSLSSKTSPATKELEAQEAEFADTFNNPHVGKGGKGAYASKGMPGKGRR